MLVKLFVVAALMFGFGFALVPMYRAICEITGINNLRAARRAAAREAKQYAGRHEPHDLDRIRRQRARPVAFKPDAAHAGRAPGRSDDGDVRSEQRAEAHGEGAGHSELRADSRPPRTSRRSSASVSRSRRSTPNETKQMPVVFVVDPKLPKDVKTITLSYTFFEVGGRTVGGEERHVTGTKSERQYARARRSASRRLREGGVLVVLRRAQARPTWKTTRPS